MTRGKSIPPESPWLEAMEKALLNLETINDTSATKIQQILVQRKACITVLQENYLTPTLTTILQAVARGKE